MKTPTVSIVIPNFNSAHCLPECIETVLHQTYDDWELIVVDDTSTDNSCLLIKRYIDQFPEKIRMMRLTRGPSSMARSVNAGVRAMRGRYFSWISPDSRSDRTKLETLVAVLENSPAGMVHSGYRVMNGEEPVDSIIPGDYPDVTAFYRLLRGNIINATTVLIRKELLDEIGPMAAMGKHSENVWCFSEYLWWLEIALRADIAVIHKPIHDVRSDGGCCRGDASGPAADVSKIAVRQFVQKYGLRKLCWMLALRTGSRPTQIYRQLTLALCADLIPEDLLIFGQVFRTATEEELAAIRQAIDVLSSERLNDVTGAMTLLESFLTAKHPSDSGQEGLARIRNAAIHRHSDLQPQ